MEVWRCVVYRKLLTRGVNSVDRWLKSHKAQCPLCKKDIREDWEDEEEEVWDPIAGKWVQESRDSDEESGEYFSGQAGSDAS